MVFILLWYILQTIYIKLDSFFNMEKQQILSLSFNPFSFLVSIISSAAY